MPLRSLIRTQGGSTETLYHNDDRFVGIKTLTKDDGTQMFLKFMASDNLEGPLLGKVAGGATFAFGFHDMYDRQGNAKICQVRRTPVGSNATSGFKTLYAQNFVEELESFCAGSDGYINRWYNQARNDVNWVKGSNFPSPKIVENGSVIRCSNGKVAMDGRNSRLVLSRMKSRVLSSNGSHSIFLAGNFPDYSGASRTNVQILQLNAASNGGANNSRKPYITINKNLNKIGCAVATQTVGSNSTGNIYAAYTTSNPSVSPHELITNIANPNKSTYNNQMWIDGVWRTATSENTIANTATAVSKNSYLFDPNETIVSTKLSSMVYYPKDVFESINPIHNNLLNQHNIS